ARSKKAGAAWTCRRSSTKAGGASPNDSQRRDADPATKKAGPSGSATASRIHARDWENRPECWKTWSRWWQPGPVQAPAERQPVEPPGSVGAQAERQPAERPGSVGAQAERQPAEPPGSVGAQAERQPVEPPESVRARAERP